MTKEEILDEADDNHSYDLGDRQVTEQAAMEAMGVHAKEEAIEFANFRDAFRRAESWSVRQEEKRLGGMITWMGANDDRVWEEYQESKNHDIKFLANVEFDIISEKEGEKKIQGWVRAISYKNKTAEVEYGLNNEIMFRVFPFDKLYLKSKP